MMRACLALAVVVPFVGSLTCLWGQEVERVVVGRTATMGEVLRQGPVHEAFAARDGGRPQVPPPAGQAPPAPIQEVRPAIAPELEERAVWIPGYWQWDAGRNDFLWVCGVWRFPPPDRRWVPGHWAQTDQGPRRVAGFWLPKGVTEVRTFPEPQDYKDETGAKQIAAGQFWVPGIPVYAEGKHQWREGYAAKAVDNWVWAPARWQWTDRGWIFLEGFWDYPLKARGQVFAALDFQTDDYAQPDFRLVAAYPAPLDRIAETEVGGLYEFDGDADLAPDRSVALAPPAFDLPAPPPPGPVLVAAPTPRLGEVRGVARRLKLAPPGIVIKIEGTAIPPVRTDNQGRFVFRDVPYGEYSVTASGPVQNITRRGVVRIQLAAPVLDEVVIPLD